MSAFNTKCIMDKMRDNTKLEDNYQQVRNIPPLLICNQNGHERIQKDLLSSSILLGKNFDLESENMKNLNQNFNDRIYSRNVPTGNIPVNIDTRPIPTGRCIDARFQKERQSLDKYNKYEVNYKCEDDKIFMPDKGTVSGFFNNIDLDSELKNINQIDTKCSKRFFKVNPDDKKTKLKCYEDTLVKDYQKCENDVGYTWCKYNKTLNFEPFEECEKKEFNCVKEKKNTPNKNLVKGHDSKELERGQEIMTEKIKDLVLDLELLEKKKQIIMKKYLPEENNIKPNSVIQYKSNDHTNIYAPIIRKRDVNTSKAENLGYEQGLEKKIDIRITRKLREIERLERLKREELTHLEKMKNQKCDPLRQYSPSVKSIHIDRYARSSNSNIYDIDCRGQTKKLYKFNNLVQDDKECLYCEQIFNNQTKRKHINVGNVPFHIIENKN